MVRLSKRMEAVAALVTADGVLADVGTDHAYVPIALTERGRVQRAIAMDIGEGPLSIAAANIAAHGLSNRIETRLSDGVAKLKPKEADVILIAGLGGALMIRILSEGERVCKEARQLILQPQSEVHKVRAYLGLHGYRIDAEDMVLEDDKFYPMMRVLPDKDWVKPVECTEEYDKIRDIYGPVLLAEKHPVLRCFLEKQHRELSGILDTLCAQRKSEAIQKRIRDIQMKLAYNENAYKMLGAKREEYAEV